MFNTAILLGSAFAKPSTQHEAAPPRNLDCGCNFPEKPDCAVPLESKQGIQVSFREINETYEYTYRFKKALGQDGKLIKCDDEVAGFRCTREESREGKSELDCQVYRKGDEVPEDATFLPAGTWTEDCMGGDVKSESKKKLFSATCGEVEKTINLNECEAEIVDVTKKNGKHVLKCRHLKSSSKPANILIV